MTFSTLALVTALGLLGPVLSARKSWHLPLILGPMLAGVVFGTTGFRVLDATEPTFAFLADIGFAIVMFVAGTHVPVRDPAVRAALGAGALRAAAVGVIAAALGAALAAAFGTGHAALYAVLMASSSAAVVLPIINSNHLIGAPVLALTAQVAIADTVCVVALPLVIDPPTAPRAALGALAVGVTAFGLYLILRWSENSGLRSRLEAVSEEREFALQLRISLVALFLLSAIATTMHVSVMLAGFALGLAVAAVGEPRRMAAQLFAIGEGFFAPLFFVWLGARVNLRDLVDHPRFILLGLALGLGAIAAHIAMRLAGLPIPLGVLAAAQIGVPVAAVTVGEQLGLFAAGEGSALILGALITIAGAAIAAGRATSGSSGPPPSAPASPGAAPATPS
ncbi:Sodium/hydrogen exchanger OS=Tsukamurella paurometabola (strain ATCC 8368 / DSM / CCUG 35730/ CIP 100753 / JCM 10117 / KCTC 9821 / NBRC 16120 / NCIMB 702349/ NCTC 13040) OX=521096 GN=Tpau_2280 PE=4 SV=1 [Tsukamurella paurometabola]|uniref:Sodium/hydrogen exchanger n=1 Tax=Tsukamurella paurometabola (strain ATCC 8368 / DSM 20162 / CCUG 35730 / CIP 100753 / JCM 10117 / KCTC 9821 / NBRC 16120 / NCIMB 702349 / NCTC 13040) TaxID=521096 RepID=D5UQB7_TSUPD|nr:cation:proton antiporter [Tsukamurella paurometabola]ADG78887.1 sodium/hydrogen exchanger [Tsukamurella paurometabola DSM 20162]SUP33424.1 transporter, monovalent cation:proton antiporter-2 (CPA2) family [Tsukamurella paurometabola]